MFDLSKVGKITFEYPWSIGYSQRVRLWAGGKMRIAYYYENPDNSTFRYRVYNTVSAINKGSDYFRAAWFHSGDIGYFSELSELADCLVICRVRYSHHVSSLIGMFHAKGKRVLFDVDDLVFDADQVHLLIESLDLDVNNPQVWDDWFAYCSRMGKTLRMCDGAITTNKFLAQRIGEFSGLTVSVVPNFLNDDQLNFSNLVYQHKAHQLPGCKDGKWQLGYFSGSPSHNRDFALIVPALENLLDSNPDVTVLIVGYIDIEPRLHRFANRISRHPFVDYVNLQKLIAQVEINLMPLQYNEFTNCKSELKYFEASIVGTVSVATPTEVYSSVIRHGNNGYVAQAHEWESVIESVISSGRHYLQIAEQAHADALSGYSPSVHRNTILQAVGVID